MSILLKIPKLVMGYNTQEDAPTPIIRIKTIHFHTEQMMDGIIAIWDVLVVVLMIFASHWGWMKYQQESTS